MTPLSSNAASFGITTLVFLHNSAGELLLLKRRKAPNQGLWSPIGGKLWTQLGESPLECALRETREETGFQLSAQSVRLFAMVAEKNYQGCGHWLMFLFYGREPLPHLPPPCEEGEFAFFPRDHIPQLDIPTTDRTFIWSLYDRYRLDHFVSVSAYFEDEGTLHHQIDAEVGPGLTHAPKKSSSLQPSA